MKIRRQITGVLCSLLDGYSSRYSDYDGYWIFGLLLREADSTTFDLLRESSGPCAFPLHVASWRMARSRLEAAMAKQHIPFQVLSAAILRIVKLEPQINDWVNGTMTPGYRLNLQAEAVSDLGKRYVAEKVIFVAPHNPAVERRSVRREA